MGVAVHRTLGVNYGIAASAMVKAGEHPMVAGLAVGAAALVLVDEGTAINLFLAYPLARHLGGVLGQATFGLATSAMLSLIAQPN